MILVNGIQSLTVYSSMSSKQVPYFFKNMEPYKNSRIKGITLLVP